MLTKRLLLLSVSMSTLIFGGTSNAVANDFLKGFLPPKGMLSGISAVKPRADVYVKGRSGRTIMGTELWMPLSWNGRLLTYTDLRLVHDTLESMEGNAGLGLRLVSEDKQRIYGAYGFYDRRRSSYDQYYSQATFGGELLTDHWDVRGNYYLPLSDAKIISETDESQLVFSGSGASIVRSFSQFKEVPYGGLDFEVGRDLGMVSEDYLADTKLFLAGFMFDADDVEHMAGYRLRLQSRFWNDRLQVGIEHQRDNIRGTNNFAELRLRMPLADFAPNAVPQGIYKRLNENVVRDIDIVTQAGSFAPSRRQEQDEVVDDGLGTSVSFYHVNNQAVSSGNGWVETPFDTLAGAEAVAGAGDVIYVHAGDGTTSGLDQGITLDDAGQRLIGSGANLTLADIGARGRRNSFARDRVIIRAGDAPQLTAAAGNVVNVSADSVQVRGVDIVDAPTRGVYVLNANNVMVRDVSVSDSGERGIYARFDNGGTYQFDAVGNTVNRAKSDGIVVHSIGASDVTALVQGNEVRGSAYQDYVALSNGTAQMTATIKNNTSYGAGNYSYFVEAQANSVADVTLEGNLSSDAQDGGFYLEADTAGQLDFRLQDNIVKKAGSIGVYFRGLNNAVLSGTVQGDLYEDVGSYGIYANITNDASLTVDLNEIDLVRSADHQFYTTARNNSVVDVTLRNSRMDMAGDYGMYAYLGEDADFTYRMDNVQTSGVGQIGVYTYARNNSVFDVSITDSTFDGMRDYGAYLYAINDTNGRFDVRDSTFLNTGNYGSYVYGTTNAVVNSVISGNSYSGGDMGVAVLSVGAAQVDIDVHDNVITNVNDNGIYLYAANTARLDADVRRNRLSDAGDMGAYFYSRNDADMSVLFEGNSISGAFIHSMFVNEDSTLANVIDLGGGALGSLGGNSFGKTRRDTIRVDVDGAELKAENNYWGSATGLAVADIDFDAASTIDTAPFLAIDPN